MTRGQDEAGLSAKLASRRLRSDMDRVVPTGVAYAIDAAAERVRATYLSRLPP